MYHPKTILDMMEDSSKSKVNLRLSEKLSGGMDEMSRNSAEKILEEIENIGDSLFSSTEHLFYSLSDVLDQKDNDLTSQDIAIALFSIDSKLSEIDKTISSLKTEVGMIRLSTRDSFNENYSKQFDGTVNDRTSFAESKTVKERYTLFVKESLLSSLESRRESVSRMYKSLERFMWKIVYEEKN